MGDAYFYHLTQAPLEHTLPVLLGRSLDAGWKVAVRGRTSQRLTWLDQILWQGREDDFLPHGIAGGKHDALQPILLTTDQAGNSPQCLMSVDGAEVTPDEVTTLKRVCILFDGNDPEAVNLARGQWKALTAHGCGAKYWSEETGKWQMKSESPSQVKES